MRNLAAWRYLENSNNESKPLKKRSSIGLEKDFEDWIADDITRLGDGLTLVGRQLSLRARRLDLHGGRLDLLAIDYRDRLVVVEVKPDKMTADALKQAICYASSIADIGLDKLEEKIESSTHEFLDSDELRQRFARLKDTEYAKPDIVLMLVGVGIHPELERMCEYLKDNGFGVPIKIVNFEVFQFENGQNVLIREVFYERDIEPQTTPKLTVDRIRSWAKEEGVVKQFDRFVKIAEYSGLAVQPQKASVRIAPSFDRRLYLMYTQPRPGKLYLEAGAGQFAKYFSVDEGKAEEALKDINGSWSGKELDGKLDQIQEFLHKNQSCIRSK